MDLEWRKIDGFDYSVSNTGLIRNDRNGRLVSTNRKDGETVRVNVWSRGKRKNLTVHTLVAQAFLPKAKEKHCVIHLDGDLQNNNVENLAWDKKRDGNFKPKTWQEKESICWRCQHSTKGKFSPCPWAARFEPVDGWSVVKRNYSLYKNEKRKLPSYNVRKCPLFKRDERRNRLESLFGKASCDSN